MTSRTSRGGQDMPDMEITKEHILAAGRELMLAADGALRFCRAYAETVASPSSRTQLISFFSKAISVADELGKGLMSASCAASAAKNAAAPVLEALGKEMVREKRPCGKKPARRKKSAGKPKRKAKTAARKKKVTRKATGRAKTKRRS